MKTKTLRTVFVSLITVTVIAVGANAFAGRGMGNQGDGSGNGGYGYHRGGGDCPYGSPNLTDEQREQLDSERQAFFTATQDVRQELYAKQLALRAEIAKKNPDPAAAADLQKMISDLRADLDQKRLNHIMTMRKIDPNAGRGFFGGGRGMGHGGRHMGPGSGMGGGMGYGMGNCVR